MFKWVVKEEQGYRYMEVAVKPNSRDYKSVQDGNRPDSSYIRETVQLEKEKRCFPKQLPPKSQHRLSRQHSESNNSSRETHEGITGIS